MVQHRLAEKHDERISDKFREWCKETGVNPSKFNLEAYDELVKMVKRSPEASDIKTVTTSVSRFIGSSYRFHLNSGIKHNMSSMKIYLSCNDPTLSSDVFLEKAVYELIVGGNVIKRGKMLQGIDLMDGNFMPFGFGAYYHNLELNVDVENDTGDGKEIELEIKAVIDMHPLILPDEIQSHILKKAICVPWKCYDINGKIEKEILVFSSGLAGMVAIY